MVEEARALKNYIKLVYSLSGVYIIPINTGLTERQVPLRES
ncbi:hypothetical protein NF27_FR00040 [Candidatus Jidaibacter acanthamoeba]|uniref:Uncharacterized protein n=1 Tax=Candidatus Jidaibacter acanthamoebae TaxID=86105 RepID=A0A0C1QL07_9RICK|nr:hypothetical protein NF27_FR00040 [Candidatus Jidaibacter acanthamoeba]